MYLEHQPAQSLSPWVEKFWYCESYQASHRRERVLPNGRFQLIIDLSGLAGPLVTGIRSGYSVIETAGLQCMIGLVFRPGGTIPFFDSTASDFCNQTVPLDLIWGMKAASLHTSLLEASNPAARLALLEAALLQEAQCRQVELHPAVRYALREFRRAPCVRRVLQVCAEARLSRRRFAQLFREQVGITPKLYCRLLRFQHVVSSASATKEVDWAALALDGGFCDQSHLANEFRAFSGMSPGDWLAQDRPFQNHVVLD